MKYHSMILGGAAALALLTTGGTPAVASGEAEWSDSTVDVRRVADPETAVGESTLRRTADGMQATFQATEVHPGYAVTLWWVVFNEPENCSPPGYGPDDVEIDGDPAAGLDLESIASVDAVAAFAAFAAGTVSSTDGTISISARIAEGAPGAPVMFGDGAVVKDVETAEIWLVARSHGPAIAGREVVQTTSYEGGCETEIYPPDVADAEGECDTLMFASHLP